MAPTEMKQIVDRLDAIKSELDYIKEHMIHIDSVLTLDDRAALAEAREEYRKGTTIPLSTLKKELGI
ncbi:MAG TPA: hypothetical protein VJC16_06080 [Candidatus Nanoarchaeia archaeon]|nr:hypothetical protein [Candidatus Nanoarchaeia archaeon]